MCIRDRERGGGVLDFFEWWWGEVATLPFLLSSTSPPSIVFKLKTLLPLSTWRGVAECLTFLNVGGVSFHHHFFYFLHLHPIQFYRNGGQRPLHQIERGGGEFGFCEWWWGE